MVFEALELLSKGSITEGENLLKGILEYTSKYRLTHFPEAKEIRKCCLLNLGLSAKDKGHMLEYVAFMFKYSKNCIKSNEHYLELSDILMAHGFVEQSKYFLKIVKDWVFWVNILGS
jgi:hypothetical protein